MLLNSTNGAVGKYYDLLLNSKVLNTEDKVYVEEIDRKNIKEEDSILLEQSSYPISEETLKKVKCIITQHILVYESFRNRIKTYLLEFPLSKSFKKTKKWSERENAIYFHGRITPSKLPLEFLKTISKEIKIVLQGPICKKYWIDEELEDEFYKEYKQEILKINNIEFLEETKDENELSNNLNKYKFYFTLSKSEAYNVALQEAIACGTIPIVNKMPETYWWAKGLYFDFDNDPNEFIRTYKKLVNLDLEKYSDVIVDEINSRTSENSICDKFKKGNFWNFIKEPTIETEKFLDFLKKKVDILSYKSFTRDDLHFYVQWEGWNKEINDYIFKKEFLLLNWEIKKWNNSTILFIKKYNCNDLNSLNNIYFQFLRDIRTITL
jgi:glycosyltransferase involved in cell wall biosynthesis